MMKGRRPSGSKPQNWAGVGLLMSTLMGVATGQPTAEDFDRALKLGATTRDKVLNRDVDVSWSSDGGWLWYRLELPGGKRSFWRVDTQTGAKRPAFDPATIAAGLRDEFAGLDEGAEIDADALPVERMLIDDDGTLHLLVVHKQGVRWGLSGERGFVWRDPDPTCPFVLSRLEGDSGARSRNSSAQSGIYFINPTGSAVRLEWVKPDGGVQRYATIEPGDTYRQHTYAGHVWRVVTSPGDKPLLRVRAEANWGVVVVGGGPSPRAESPPQDTALLPRNTSPDGGWRAITKGHNIFLRNRETREAEALTTSGTAEDAFGRNVHWSPDGRYLIAVQTRRAQEHPVSFVEASPPGQLQPKLHTFDYLKPGDRIARPRPRLFDAGSRTEVPIDDTLFSEPWSIDRYHWSPDGKTCYFLYNQRGHQALRVIALDAETGNTRAVVDEQSDTFINYSNKTYLHHFDDHDQLLWMSERDGWNHLYLIDRATGVVVRQVTRGAWLVKRVDKVEVTPGGQRLAYLTILGHPAHAGQDPYFEHHARVDLDTGKLTLLTRGDGTHQITMSPDGTTYVDRWSRVDQPPVLELRRSGDGELICELARADASVLREVLGRLPEPFVAKGRDGVTDIWGVIYRPSDFDPAKTYPVLEAIYAGPHGQHVPKSFSPFRGPQRYAELGFIVVQIDGMGTNWRSKAFHDVAWKNLKDAGFPDRIAWMGAAARHEPAMDLGRVGIYGGSAGGQNAMRAVLDHADFYKAAMADCGCHDNRMDKIWWNEAWMGYPIDESYAASSNIVDAHKLGGALLLTVGAMDRNVDPASTFQVVNALIEADKDFDLLVFPSGGHGAGGSDYGWRRTAEFFLKHLSAPSP